MMQPVGNAVITQFSRRHGRRPQSCPPRQVRIAQPDCYLRKSKHKLSECKFQAAECHFCKKKGHISKVCLTEEGDAYNTKDDLEYSMLHTRANNSKPIQVAVKLNGINAAMEVDT